MEAKIDKFKTPVLEETVKHMSGTLVKEVKVLALEEKTKNSNEIGCISRIGRKLRSLRP